MTYNVVRDYDAATNANTVDESPGALSVGDFTTMVADAFDNGRGGVINFDSPSEVVVEEFSLEATYGGGTIVFSSGAVDFLGDPVGFQNESASFHRGSEQFPLGDRLPISGQASADPQNVVGNDGMLSFSGPNGEDDKLFKFDVMYDNNSGGRINSIGATLLSRVFRNQEIIFTVEYDDASTDTFTRLKMGDPFEPGNQDVFGGFVAPEGRYITSFTVDWDTSWTSLDDLAFTVIPDTPSLPIGDYNGDNVVDAADYAVWRNSLNGDGSLLGDGRDPANGAGPVSIDDYNSWRAHYGESSLSAAADTAPAPEPSAVALLMGFAGVFCGRWRR